MTNNRKTMMNENEMNDIKSAVENADTSMFMDVRERPACDYFDWHQWVDSLDLGSGATGTFASWLGDDGAVKLRSALHRLVNLTHTVSGISVHVGRRVLGFIRRMSERFPKTCAAAIVVMVLAFMASRIPILGLLLAPLIEFVGVFAVLAMFGFEVLKQLRPLTA